MANVVAEPGGHAIDQAILIKKTLHQATGFFHALLVGLRKRDLGCITGDRHKLFDGRLFIAKNNLSDLLRMSFHCELPGNQMNKGLDRPSRRSIERGRRLKRFLSEENMAISVSFISISKL